MVFGFMFDTNVGLFPELLKALGLKSWIPKTGFLAGKTAFPMLLIYGLWSGIGNNVVLLNFARDFRGGGFGRNRLREGVHAYRDSAHRRHAFHSYSYGRNAHHRLLFATDAAYAELYGSLHFGALYRFKGKRTD